MRKATIFTGQWADLPLETMAQKMQQFGYDGLELACWGDHFDVFKGWIRFSLHRLSPGYPFLISF